MNKKLIIGTLAGITLCIIVAIIVGRYIQNENAEKNKQELMSMAQVRQDKVAAEAIGKGMRTWYIETILNENKTIPLPASFVEYTEVEGFVPEYVDEQTLRTLPDATYYICCYEENGNKKVKVAIAKNVEEANALVQNEENYDGSKAGIAYVGTLIKE